MALNLVKRFQFCLNTDDAEIVRLGLDGFADQITQNEAFQTTLAAIAINPSVVEANLVLQPNDDVELSEFPFVELYINSSPRLEEMFSVWSLFTGRRELETALSANFLRCFVFILQLMSVNDQRYGELTHRVLRDHETGIIRQLQSSDNSTIAYTMLLVSLCLRSHKSLSEPIIHALLTSFKTLKSNGYKVGKLPIHSSYCAAVTFGHLFTYLDYSQCLLAVSEEKLYIELLYHGSLPTLHLLLSLQQNLLISESPIFRDQLQYFLNNLTVNKLLTMRSKITTEEYDIIINPYLQFMVEELLKELSLVSSTQSKSILVAVHAILDNLVPQYDFMHQEIIMQALAKRPSLATRSIAALKVSDWNPTTSTFELSQALTYLTKVTTHLQYSVNSEWAKQMRTPTPILAVLFPNGLNKKELVKLVTFPTVEIQLLTLGYIHALLTVISTHQEQGQLLSITLDVIEDDIIDFKSLFAARTRIVEAYQTHFHQKQQASHLSKEDQESMKPENKQEDLVLDMDLNLDGVPEPLYPVSKPAASTATAAAAVVKPTPPPAGMGKKAMKKFLAMQKANQGADPQTKTTSSSPNELVVTTTSEEMSREEKEQKENMRMLQVLNDVVSLWIRTLDVFVRRFPTVLLQSKVDWNKVVDDLTLLSSAGSSLSSSADKKTKAAVLNTTKAVFSSDTIRDCLNFFSLIIRPSTFHVWFGYDEDINKILLNMIVTDWCTIKLSSFGHLLKFAFVGIDKTNMVALQSFIFGILKNLGLFEGHGAMEVSLMLELSNWVLHLVSTATAAVADSLMTAASISDEGNDSSEVVATVETKSKLDKLLIMFDCLLRVAIRWRIDAAITCHELTSSHYTAANSSSSASFALAPISPLAYVAMNLVCGDFQLFAPTFPAYVRKYWDLLNTKANSVAQSSVEDKETKTKEDAIQFFSRFTQGYRQALEDWLVPWLAQVIIRHPQREDIVPYWKMLYDTKLPEITLVNVHENAVYRLLKSDHTNLNVLATGGLRTLTSPKASAATKRRSFHGLPSSELKEVLLPQLQNSIAMIHILCKELPALLAFIKKQPQDAVAICLQSYLDDYGEFIRTQYFLENTSYRKVALDWISENWQREKPSSQSSTTLSSKNTLMLMVHISPLLVSLQRLQVFINDTTAQYEESKESVVTTALCMADDLFLFLMDITTHFRTSKSAVNIQLLIEMINMRQLVDFVKEATAYGMICRRVTIALLSQLPPELSTTFTYVESISVVKNANSLFANLLSTTNVALLDQTFVDLLACLLAMYCTSELLHMYFLLRLQVQANQRTLLALSTTTGIVNNNSAYNISNSGSFSQDLLWKGMQQLSVDVLWSLREQLRETFTNSQHQQLYVLYHAQHEDTNPLSLVAPELLLMLQSAPSSDDTKTNNTENKEFHVSLTSCYERSYTTSSTDSIKQLEQRLVSLLKTYASEFADKNASSNEISSMAKAFQFLVDIIIKANQQCTRVATSSDHDNTNTTTKSHDNPISNTTTKSHGYYSTIVYTASQTLLQLLISLRFSIATETTPQAQETITQQIIRWYKTMLKHQFFHASCFVLIREIVLWCYHPGIIGRVPRLKPRFVLLDNDDTDNANTAVTDFHHPMNLLVLLPKHSSFLALMSLSSPTTNSVHSENSLKQARFTLIQALIGLLQVSTQPSEWAQYSEPVQLHVRKEIFVLENMCLSYYGGSMSALDRSFLRIFQYLQYHPERLGRSWLELLPLMTHIKQQKQKMSHNSTKNKNKQSNNNNNNVISNGASLSILSFLQNHMVQRTLSDYPEHRSAMMQLFVWELMTFSTTRSNISGNSSNNNGTKSTSVTLPLSFSFSPPQVSLHNEEERWQLLKHFQQPVMPSFLADSNSNEAATYNNHQQPSYKSPAQEKYELREYEKACKRYNKWVSECEQEQVRLRKSSTSNTSVNNIVFLQDIDCTDMPSLFQTLGHLNAQKNLTSMESIGEFLSHDSSSSSHEVEHHYDDEKEQDLLEVYDPAFVIPAFLQNIVQPHVVTSNGESENGTIALPLGKEYSLRDIMASGITSLMLRSLSSSCLHLRTYGYSFMNYLWQRLHEHDASVAVNSSNNMKNTKIAAPEDDETDDEDDENSKNDEQEDGDSADDNDQNNHKAIKKKVYNNTANASATSSGVSVFRDRLVVDVFLKYIKDSIIQETSLVTPPPTNTTSTTHHSTSTGNNNKDANSNVLLLLSHTVPPQLASPTALFFARGMNILLHPKHEHYAMFTKLIVSYPYHKHSELPWFKTLILQASNYTTNTDSSATTNNNNNNNGSNEQEGLLERLSALRFLRDCLQYHTSASNFHFANSNSNGNANSNSNGINSNIVRYPSTHHMFVQRQVYAHLLQHFALFGTRDLRCAQCILDIFEHAMGHPDSAHFLLSTVVISNQNNSSNSDHHDTTHTSSTNMNMTMTTSTRGYDLLAFLFSQAMVIPASVSSHSGYHSTILNVLGGSYALRWLALLRKIAAATALLTLSKPSTSVSRQENLRFLETLLLQAIQVCTEHILLYTAELSTSQNNSHNSSSSSSSSKDEQFVSFVSATCATWQEIACTLLSTTTTNDSTSLPMIIQNALVISISQLYAQYPVWSVVFQHRHHSTSTSTDDSNNNVPSAEAMMWCYAKLLSLAPTAFATSLRSSNNTSTTTVALLWRWMMKWSLQRTTKTSPLSSNNRTSETVFLFPVTINSTTETSSNSKEDTQLPLLAEVDTIWQRYQLLCHQWNMAPTHVTSSDHPSSSTTTTNSTHWIVKIVQPSYFNVSGQNNHHSSMVVDEKREEAVYECLWRDLQKRCSSQFNTTNVRMSNHVSTMRYLVTALSQHLVAQRNADLQDSSTIHDNNAYSIVDSGLLQESLTYTLCLQSLLHANKSHSSDMMHEIIVFTTLLLEMSAAGSIVTDGRQTFASSLLSTTHNHNEDDSGSRPWQVVVYQKVFQPLFQSYVSNNRITKDNNANQEWQAAVVTLVALLLTFYTRNSINSSNNGNVLSPLEWAVLQKSLQTSVDLCQKYQVFNGQQNINKNHSMHKKRVRDDEAELLDLTMDSDDAKEVSGGDRSTKKRNMKIAHRKRLRDELGVENDNDSIRHRKKVRKWKPFHLRLRW